MENLLDLNTIIHVALGFTALVTGLISMIVVKGNKIHRNSGLVYFYSMIGIVITAVVISIHKQMPFFIALSVFVFYLVYTGFRYARNHLYKPDIKDWIIDNMLIVWLAPTVIGTIFIIYSIRKYTKKSNKKGLVLREIPEQIE